MVGEGWGILTDACKCVYTFTNTLKLMDVIVKSLEARCLQGNLPLSHIMTGKQGSLYQYKHRAWVIGEIIDFPFMILLKSGDDKRQCCSKRFYTWWL